MYYYYPAAYFRILRHYVPARKFARICRGGGCQVVWVPREDGTSDGFGLALYDAGIGNGFRLFPREVLLM